MPHIHTNRRKPVSAVLIILLPSLVLAACGGSSSGSSTNSAATATGVAATGTTGGAPGPGRFSALRECLAKNGVTLPQRTPGQGRPGGGLGGLLGGAGSRLPQGVTRAQFEAALKKCGAPAGGFGAHNRLASPAATAALTKFASCMRENGQNVPAPNTSGNGPIFNTNGLNTSSPQFRTALAKCASSLHSTLRPHGVSTGAPPPVV